MPGDSVDRVLLTIKSLLEDRECKDVTIAQLRRQLTEVNGDRRQDDEASAKNVIRQAIWKLENIRPPPVLEDIAQQPSEVCHNLPCMLYLLGLDVPMPKAADDSAWSGLWAAWLTAHGDLARVISEHNGFRGPPHPSVSDTFAAKRALLDTRMPVLALQWWDELRRFCGLPPWLSSANKMYA